MQTCIKKIFWDIDSNEKWSKIKFDIKCCTVYTHLFLYNGETFRHVIITYINVLVTKNILFSWIKRTICICKGMYGLKFVKK